MARGTLCARASQVACTLRPRQGSAPLRYLGGSAWQLCCAALEVWLCSAAAHPPMLRKDVDAVEKTTVVEKDRAGARMGGCCQLVSRWTGHGPTLGSNATACGCFNRRRLPRSAVTLAPCWRHSFPVSQCESEINAVRTRSHYICRSLLHFSYRALVLRLELPEALHAGGVQASRPSRGRALTESRLSTGFPDLGNGGKSTDVDEL